MDTQEASVLQENLPALKGDISPAKGLPGSQSVITEPLGNNSDLPRQV